MLTNSPKTAGNSLIKSQQDTSRDTRKIQRDLQSKWVCGQFQMGQASFEDGTDYSEGKMSLQNNRWSII